MQSESLLTINFPRFSEQAMHSCIYRGSVEHERLAPTNHRFRYSLFWLYLDLDELPLVLRSVALLSTRRLAVASFCRGDHFDHESGRSLPTSIRAFVHGETGLSLKGPIRCLTQLRQFGVYFSPLNLYFCFDQAGEELIAVVAEVSNTPWNERHHYLLWEGNRLPGSIGRFSHAKAFHVSPFMDMDLNYDWRLASPSEQLHVALSCRRGDDRLFHAHMQLQREPLNNRHLARALCRYPIAALQILAAIHLQALRLWMKKCPYFPHPKTKAAAHCRAV